MADRRIAHRSTRRTVVSTSPWTRVAVVVVAAGVTIGMIFACVLMAAYLAARAGAL